jgi:hypothetical protein
MKKSNLFKSLLGVAAVMLLTSGVFGQVANVNYTQYDANLLAPTNIDYVTLKAPSTVMGYYALPDPVYHPNYNAGGAWALTPLFTWDWSVAPVMATAKPGAANYVEITYTATGNYVVNVAEHAPAAFGGCVDATPTVMNVTVINPPVATVVTADPAQACGDQVAMAVAMTFTEAVPLALAGYSFAINETVENIDAADALIGPALVNNNTFVNYPTTGKLKTPVLTGAASPYGFSFNTSALTVRGGMRTRYTYTAIKASDAPGAAANGVISAISQKSDFLAGTPATYAFTDNQIVIIVNPAPATGPIYYIPNNFNY